MTLPSNVLSIESNTIADFTTHLPRSIELKGNWKVGLAQISYTKSWYNVLNDAKVSISDDRGTHYLSSVEIMAGMYETEKSLIKAIEEAIEALKPEIDMLLAKVVKLPVISFNENTRRVQIDSGTTAKGQSLYLHLSMEIEEMLGLDSKVKYTVFDNVEDIAVDFKEKFVKGSQNSFRTYDLNAGIHSLFVYCNLVEPVFVGNKFAQLLSTVSIPSRVKFSNQFVERYSAPFYQPLSKNTFQSIEIKICDDNGKLIPFKFGRTIVTLHFVKDGSSNEIYT